MKFFFTGIKKTILTFNFVGNKMKKRFNLFRGIIAVNKGNGTTPRNQKLK